MELTHRNMTAPTLRDLDTAVSDFANKVHQVMSYDEQGHIQCDIQDPKLKIEFMLNRFPEMLQLIFMFNHALKQMKNATHDNIIRLV